MTQQHESLIGEVIDGRYRLGAFLGAGSFAWVYAADEISLGGVVGQVAVKLLRPQDDAAREAVAREASALARLDHPNILRFRRHGLVKDGEARGDWYIATDLASESLRDRLSSPAPVSCDDAREVASQLASALAYLAERGAVHRDVKPENILRADNAWKLGDFGLVRGMDGSRLSRTGRKGTLLYMAPEQCTGVGLGPATDVWALGVVIQECLAREMPYRHSTDAEFVTSIISVEPHIASSLPEPLASVVRGCLVKDPQKRWTAARVLQVLGHASAVQDRINLKDGAELVYVPAGKVITRSSHGSSNDTPERRAYVDNFWMYKHPVTVAQYRRFCSETRRKMPNAPPWGWKDDHPIVNVTWEHAEAYSRWAGVALPTEEQWIRAARGQHDWAWPWGSAFEADRCVCSVHEPKRSTEPVGCLPWGASPYGCHDMAGNVWEWCSTPRGRVARGGCWRNKVLESLAIDRFTSEGAISRLDHIVGLRCVT